MSEIIEEGIVEETPAVDPVVRKSDGQDGPPVIRLVENANTPGALNSALNQPAPKDDEGFDPNHRFMGRQEIVDAENCIIRDYDSQGQLRKKIAICGFASSTRGAIPVESDEWALWGLNQLGRHVKRFSRSADLHAEPFTELVPGTEGDGPGSYLYWMRTCGIPILLLKRDPSIPLSVAYPIDRLIAKFGIDYFTSSIAYLLALALDEIDRAVETRLTDEDEMNHVDKRTVASVLARQRALYEEYTIGIFGVDLVVSDEYFWQKACGEFWIGMALSRGIQVMIPPQSALCKQQFRYGFEKDPPSIIKPREIEGHVKRLTTERDEGLKRLYMMEGALQVLDAPVDAPKDVAVIRKERDETLKRLLMLEGALQSDAYWHELLDLRLRGADVRP